MRRRSSLFGKQARAALAFVLSLQMCISPMQTVWAAPADETVALADGWEIANQNENLVMNEDGSITITTEKGTIGADDQLVKNALYYKVDSDENLEFTVKVKGKPNQNYQYVGLAIANNVVESNRQEGLFLSEAVGVVRRYHTSFNGGNNMGMFGAGFGETYEQVAAEDVYDPGDGTEEFYLKLKKEGTKISGYYAAEYSDTDEGWNRMNGDDWSVEKGTVYDENVYLAVVAGSGGSDNPTTVTFSEVRVNGNLIDFKAEEGSFQRLKVEAEKTLADIYDPVQITATPYDPDGNVIEGDIDYTYTSSNEAVATVNENGLVEGQSYGTARITASATIGGVTKSGSVDMSFGAFTEITALDTVTLERGRKTTVEVETAPANSPDKLVWSSSKEDVATVTQDGEIAAVGVGATVVTVASTIKPEIKDDIVVIVNAESLVLNDGWEIIKPNADKVVYNDLNSVTITTEKGVLNDANAQPYNLFGRELELPEGVEDFSVSARISGGLNADYQGGFVVVYDKANPVKTHVAAGRRHHNWWSGQNLNTTVAPAVGMMGNVETADVSEFYCDEDTTKLEEDIYIKIEKKGNDFYGYYSYDGIDWTEILGKNNNDRKDHNKIVNATLADAEDLCIGFYASAGGPDTLTPIDITFSEYALGIPQVVEEDGEEVTKEVVEQLDILKYGEGATDDFKKLLDKLSAAKDEEVRLKAEQTVTLNKAKALKEAADTATAAAAKATEDAAKAAEDAAKAQTKADNAQTKANEAQAAADAAQAAADAKAAEAVKTVEAAEAAKAAVQAKLDETNKALADAQKKVDETQKALAAANAAPTVEVGDTCVAKNIVYQITDTKALTAKVTGTNKSSIKTVTIPATIKFKGVTYKVTEIGNNAFEDCNKLTKVTIGTNVTKIGKKAFYKASKLATVKVSSKVLKSVGSQSFKGVSKKIKVTVPKDKKTAYKKLFKKGGVSSSKVK